ncbi:tripartite tricarboxylate transporter substrate-binding protein [Curvibacter sp. RS43]|uniref:Bug family tripartite tricarboxylate transporter substrate binding protein n=1 Tax=Curvibacter microcysteis TaxID=3026419 RepID=UPI00235DF2FB|nr:tripartite tricarboxylate transporter substrate-binding protein [Curvibacter sp. RS43]MDD0812281.1 tripartite tricarboxylate transporter substrate-binding protein [Curvibacter sp. RS43]
MPFTPTRRQTLGKILLSSLTLASGLGMGSAQADLATPGWPSKTVRIVVGFPGGSSPDLVARTLAEPLSKALGQPVIVENRVGAAGNIAAQLVAQATDQHTLGLMINGNMTVARLLNPKLGFDPLKDLAPISLIATAPLVLATPASPSTSALNAKAALDSARQAGSQWSYGSPGVGTVAHIGMEALKGRAKMEAVHVPYPGNPQVITGMIGGQLQLALLPPGLAQAQIKAGKLHAIAVTSSTRSTLVPDIPSLSEAGVPGFNLEIWDALAAPASMPAPIVARLSALVSEISRSPDVRAKLYQQGWQVVGSSSEGLANRIQSDLKSLGEVVQRQGIKTD